MKSYKGPNTRMDSLNDLGDRKWT